MLNSFRLFNKKNIQYIPDKGGIYFFQDKQKAIIYIGKAKKLRNRIKSYYYKIQKLKSGFNDIPLVHRNLCLNISFFNYKITPNELESLLVENDMIKKYMPEYNIKQKNFPEYKFIEISNNKYPFLKITSKPDQNADWYGPYKDKFYAVDLINFIADLYLIRSCQDDQPHKKCLRYNLNKCSAPCRNKISPAEYSVLVKSVKKFLTGNPNKALADLQIKLNLAVDKKDIKKQKQIKKNIQFVQKFTSFQRFANRFYHNYFILAELSTDPPHYYVFTQGKWSKAGESSIYNSPLFNSPGTDYFDNILIMYDQAKILYRYINSQNTDCGFFFYKNSEVKKI